MRSLSGVATNLMAGRSKKSFSHSKIRVAMVQAAKYDSYQSRFLLGSEISISSSLMRLSNQSSISVQVARSCAIGAVASWGSAFPKASGSSGFTNSPGPG